MLGMFAARATTRSNGTRPVHGLQKIVNGVEFLIVIVSLAAAITSSAALDGRFAVTQYSWKNTDCSGPIDEVLATYQLHECVLSVIVADGHLKISYAYGPDGRPTGIVYSHFTDSSCSPQSFLNNDTEGLLSCTPGNLGSDMMVYGPAGITLTRYANRRCNGQPADTKHYLSFACFNLPSGNGSEMVSLHYHHFYSEPECKGKETRQNVTMYNPDGTVNAVCTPSLGGSSSSKYAIGPPGYF